MKLRKLRLSLRRRCPACGAEHVSKLHGHYYQCDRCRRPFRGFRIGPVRISL